jgi:hypothetical protein
MPVLSQGWRTRERYQTGTCCRGPADARLVEARPAGATEGGVRTGFIVFDLKYLSQIPAICEPVFSTLKATVELMPVMNGEDLQNARAG